MGSVLTEARKGGGTSPSGKGSTSGWSPPEREGARPSGVLGFHAGDGRRKERGSGGPGAGTRSVDDLERCLRGAVARLAVGTLTSSLLRLRFFEN